MKSPWIDRSLIEMAEQLRKAVDKLILLDFDGTLVDFTAFAADALPSKDLLNLLQKISSITDNQLIIITGRKNSEIDRLVGQLPVDIIAEHGAMIRENYVWRTLLDSNTGWKKEVFPVIRKYSTISPNSFIEEKFYSLAWHYRNVDHFTGETNSRELIKVLRKISVRHNLRIMDGNKVVEIISSNINKGAAVRYLLTKKNYDYILAIGDDETDEDMFRILLNNKNAFTVKIGQGTTSAKYKLNSNQQVLMLLEQLVTETG